MVLGNTSGILYSSNTTTDGAPEVSNASKSSSWQMTSLDVLDLALTGVELTLCLVGFTMNCLVVDTSRNIRRKTAGTKWMKLVAVWDNVAALGLCINLGIIQIFGMDSMIMSIIGCRLFVFLFWFGATNASAHLACLACDRAFVLVSPRKHFKVQWDQMIPKISLGITLFYGLMATPHLYEKETDMYTCKMKNSVLKVYQALFATLFSALPHFSLILVASILFVYKLRHRKDDRKSSKGKIEVKKGNLDAGNNQSESTDITKNSVNLKIDLEIGGREFPSTPQITGSSKAYQEISLDEPESEEGKSEKVQTEETYRTGEKHGTDGKQNLITIDDTKPTHDNNIGSFLAQYSDVERKLKTMSGKSMKKQNEAKRLEKDVLEHGALVRSINECSGKTGKTEPEIVNSVDAKHNCDKEDAIERIQVSQKIQFHIGDQIIETFVDTKTDEDKKEEREKKAEEEEEEEEEEDEHEEARREKMNEKKETESLHDKSNLPQKTPQVGNKKMYL